MLDRELTNTRLRGNRDAVGSFVEEGSKTPKMGLKGRIRSMPRVFCEYTSIHPLSEVTRTPVRCLKPLWVVAFIVGFTLLVLHIRNLVVIYLAYPVQMQMTVESYPAMHFPAVTICNLNSLKRIKVLDSLLHELACMDESYGDCDTNSVSVDALLQEMQDWGGLEFLHNGSLGIGVDYGNPSSGDYPDGTGSGDGSYTTSGYTDVDPDSSGSGSGEGVDYEFDYYSGTSELSGGMEVDAGQTSRQERKLYESFLESMKSSTEGAAGKAFRHLVKSSQTDDFSDIISLLQFPPGIVKRYGYSIDEMLLECSYDKAACGVQDFTSYYSSSYGNCMTFNNALVGNGNSSEPKTIRITKRYGHRYGLKVTLNVKTSEYLGILSQEHGVKVVIHPATEVPDPSSKGFLGPPGALTSIGIRKKTMLRRKYPYASMCQDKIPEKYVNFTTIPMTASHTKQQCIAACFASYLHECCHCVHLDGTYEAFLPNGSNVQGFSVLNLTHYQCRQDTERQFFLPAENPEHKECDCSSMCTEESYEGLVYQADWPAKDRIRISEKYVKNSPQSGEYEYMFAQRVERSVSETFAASKKDYVRIHVYYEDLIETVLQEVPALSFSQMFADVGGTMGIYLGFTIVTILETFQFIFLACTNHVAQTATGKN